MKIKDNLSGDRSSKTPEIYMDTSTKSLPSIKSPLDNLLTGGEL